jgi:hypothetical protein
VLFSSMQVFKVFVLARVTPAALRQLISSTQAAGTSAGNVSAASKPGALATAKSSAARAASALAAKDPPAAQAQDDGGSAEAAGTAGAVAGYEVPSDEVLAASNIYSTAEACLLAWMSHHMAKAAPHLVRLKACASRGAPLLQLLAGGDRHACCCSVSCWNQRAQVLTQGHVPGLLLQAMQVTSFGEDLQNGLVLGALLAAHWPGEVGVRGAGWCCSEPGHTSSQGL